MTQPSWATRIGLWAARRPRTGPSGSVWLPVLLAIVVIIALLGYFWNAMGRPRFPRKLVKTEARLQYDKLCAGKRKAGEGQHAEALALFEQLVQGDNTRPAYRWDSKIQAAASMGGLGRNQDGLERINQCITDLRKATRYAEMIPGARIVKAVIYSLDEQYDEGLEILENVVVNNTNIRPRICADALFTISRVYERMAQFGLGRSALERIAMDFPGPEDSFKNVAVMRMEEFDEGIRQQQTPLLAESQLSRIESLPDGQQHTWSADGGPYLVTQMLVVGADSTLTIEAGTQIHFSIDGGIQVDGSLEATGTAAAPVRLVTLHDAPDSEWFRGLIVPRSEANPSVRLTHCQIAGATIGLYADGGQVQMTHCLLDRCSRLALLASGNANVQMDHCQIDMARRVAVQGDRKATLQLQDCSIKQARSHAVIFKEVQQGSYLRRTVIDSCGGTGIYVRQGCKPSIEQCIVKNNRSDGIHSLENASPAIVNNTLSANGGAGIRLNDRWAAVIQGNQITGNSAGGIHAETSCAGLISENLIAENDQAGIYLRLACRPAITGNRILDNGGPGLLLQEGSQPESLANNQFAGNGQAALRNEAETTVDAAGNWWGTTEADQIAEMIQDHSDDPNWGQVNYEPWLEAAPAASPMAADSARSL